MIDSGYDHVWDKLREDIIVGMANGTWRGADTGSYRRLPKTTEVDLTPCQLELLVPKVEISVMVGDGDGEN